MESLRSIQDALPLTIRRRFEWVGSYVTDFVASREENMSAEAKLTGRQQQVLKLVMFVWLLDRFLRDGSRAAEHAVDEFARLNVPGFQVGTTTFSGRNEAVLMGQHLADALRKSESVGSVLQRLAGAQLPHRAAVIAYNEIRRRGK